MTIKLLHITGQAGIILHFFLHFVLGVHIL